MADVDNGPPTFGGRPSVWSPEAGIALGDHWLGANGEMVVFADGRARLPHEVASGESVSMSLDIQAPSQPGHYLVEFDLVEEGVTWFKARNGYCGFTEVIVEDWP